MHGKQFIQPLNLAVLRKLTDDAVKLMTIAPELDPSCATIDYLKEHHIAASLGHSNATVEEAHRAFDRGVRMVTHTFNAAPPIHHRNPGAIAAALLDDRVSCALIADGKHLDPQMIKLVFRLKGATQVILVTDAAQIGTTGGGLVGSSITLSEAVLNIVDWQVASFVEAVRMATWNPAKAIGIDKEVGRLDIGMKGDVLVWNQNPLGLKHVILGGQLVY